MGWKIEDIANQNFQPGSDYLKSIANAARKEYCSSGTALGDWADDNNTMPVPLKSLLKEFDRSICELPQEPVPLPPANRRPSNEGQCVGLLYRVNNSWADNSGSINTDFTNVFGPVTPYSRTFVDGPNIFTEIGYTYFGREGAPTPGQMQTNITRSQQQATGLRFAAWSATPFSPNNPQPTECKRPTLPTDPVDRRPPVDRPRVRIPSPGFPDIDLPIFPVPRIVAPGIKFEPKLILDVGGINIEFNVGGVDLSFSPTLIAPITIFPPGFGLPSLPPTINPDGGSSSTCDLTPVLDRLQLARGEIEVVRSEVIEAQNIANNISNVQLNTVVPLLQDIQDCVCLPDAILFSSVGNVQDYLFPAGEEELAFATIRLISGSDKAKTFGTPNGETVTIIGWYAFGRSGRWGERKGLQYSNNLLVPIGRGWNTFTFSLYNGLTANLQLFTYKKPTP